MVLSSGCCGVKASRTCSVLAREERILTEPVFVSAVNVGYAPVLFSLSQCDTRYHNIILPQVWRLSSKKCSPVQYPLRIQIVLDLPHLFNGFRWVHFLKIGGFYLADTVFRRYGAL